MEQLIEYGPIPLGIALIYGGTQIEDKDDKNDESKGKTVLSKVLYVLGGMLILGGIIYITNKYSSNERDNERRRDFAF